MNIKAGLSERQEEGEFTMRSLPVQCTPHLNIIFDDQKPLRARPIKVSRVYK